MLAHPEWIPPEPVPFDAIDLELLHDSPAPELDGSEPETEHVRPRMSAVKRYPRYTYAIRDLAHPRLFENRMSWRLMSLEWASGKGRMAFDCTTFFAATDVNEAVSHETAYVALGADGTLAREPAMRDLPFRRLVGDPFDLNRRVNMPSVDTLVIRRDGDEASFILHRRDSKAVTLAGGMLHVMPCGVFQPSSVLPEAVDADFDLWRNFQREFSEELLGNLEHGGDEQPVDYGAEPFATLDRARDAGQVALWCLGVGLDALTLVGEIMSVAVFDAPAYDDLARDFVAANDEGAIVAERVPFTEDGVRRVVESGRCAPAAEGILRLAWQHRGHILA